MKRFIFSSLLTPILIITLITSHAAPLPPALLADDNDIVTINTNLFTRGNSEAREKARAKALTDAIRNGFSVRILGANQIVLRDPVTLELARDGQFIEGSLSNYKFSPIPNDNKVTYKDLTQAPIIGLNAGGRIVLSGSGTKLKGIKILDHNFSDFSGVRIARSYIESPGCIEISPDAADAEITGIHVNCVFTGLYSRGPVQSTLSIKGSYFYSSWTTPFIYNMADAQPSEEPFMQRERRSNPLLCPTMPDVSTDDTSTPTTPPPYYCNSCNNNHLSLWFRNRHTQHIF